MAKQKKEKSPVQKAFEDARAHYAKAKEANEKNDNATTKKTLAEAKEKRDTAMVAAARERFINIGDARTKKAIAALSQIGKMNQPRNYNYADTDITVIEKLILDAAKSAVASLRTAIAGKQSGTESAPANIFAN